MKIRFFIPALYNSAGMERISTGLANILKRKGYDCGFVVKESNTNSFFPLLEGITIKSLNVDGDIKKVRCKAGKELRKYLKEERPDIFVNVDVSMIQISALACHFLYGVKMLTWEQFSAAAINTLPKKLQRYLATTICRKMIVLTEADKAMYPKILQKKVCVIGNFTQINPENIHTNLSNNTVISVGRMANEKGFDLLLQAWQKVKEAYPDWKLKIFGGGKEEYVSMLKNLAHKLQVEDVVELNAPVKEIGREYEKASIYVLPSRHEPFGLVLIEAKSFGLPVVSFDCPYGPKEIVKDGVDGFLAENENVEDLANKLKALIADKALREKFSFEAIEDYKARWAENRVEDKWTTLLNNL